MIDGDGHCSLIEVNSSPQMSKDCLIDELVKQKMIEEIIDIVDPHQIDYSELIKGLNQYLAV